MSVKNTILLQKSINYGRKKFYNIWPQESQNGGIRNSEVGEREISHNIHTKPIETDQLKETQEKEQ